MDEEPKFPEIARTDRSVSIERIRAVPEYADLTCEQAEAVLDSLYHFAAVVYHYCALSSRFENFNSRIP